MQNNLKGKKVLVTGCAGFIGSFITESLLTNGAIVFGIDNLNTGSLENIKHILKSPYFKFTKGDICNEKQTEKLISEIDYIYHAAVRGIGLSTENPLLESRVNIQGTLLILELMRKYKKVKKLIYASSASVYGNTQNQPEKESDPTNPISPYGVSKLAAEKYVIAYHYLYNLPVCALRYFNVYGPRQRWDSQYGGVVSIFLHNALLDKPLSIYGDGKQTRDFTYIEDAVKPTIESFFVKDAIGKVINISGGREYSIKYLAQKVNEVSKKNIPIIYSNGRIIDNINRRFGDNNLAKKILSFSPKISIEKGLKLTFNWHKKNLTRTI